MKHRNQNRRMARQRGAVLVVSLLLLLVMTLLGLGASQSTRLQERMAGNQRDMDLAFQGGETGLRAAEERLVVTYAGSGSSIITCADAKPNTDICDSYEMGTFLVVGPDNTTTALDLAKQSDDWWQNWGRRYQFPADVGQPPTEYVNQLIAKRRDTVSRGSSYLTLVREYHQSTARSSGQTESAEAVLQSNYLQLKFE
jgi:type IV pilus assembly protein PilX